MCIRDRNNIALIQQEVFLFSDSILNNITLFDETITKSDVLDASKAIGIHSFIDSLPNGYDYVLGERGVNLSAGQRQLIAFLRVYVRESRILILDEATSSIDTETEKLLKRALKKVSKDRTTIIIAHRLSTIIEADKILHIKDGLVLEEGTHSDLMNKEGPYSKMYKLQNTDSHNR